MGEVMCAILARDICAILIVSTWPCLSQIWVYTMVVPDD